MTWNDLTEKGADLAMNYIIMVLFFQFTGYPLLKTRMRGQVEGDQMSNRSPSRFASEYFTWWYDCLKFTADYLFLITQYIDFRYEQVWVLFK